MTLGISLAFVISFIFFPSFLGMMSPKPSVSAHDITKQLTTGIALMALHHKNKIFALFAVLTLAAGIGLTKLGVDNRFIDYFKETTEIHRGMSVIDTQLGGTTPLEILIDADQNYYDYLKMLEEEKDEFFEGDDPFAEHEDTAGGKLLVSPQQTAGSGKGTRLSAKPAGNRQGPVHGVPPSRSCGS